MVSRAKPILALAAALLLVACGGGGGGGGGGNEGSDLPTEATATSEDEEGTVYALAPGRYRLSWTAEDCATPDIRITDEGGEVIFEHSSAIKITFVREVLGGNYLIEQLNPECTSWEIKMLWQGNLR